MSAFSLVVNNVSLRPARIWFVILVGLSAMIPAMGQQSAQDRPAVAKVDASIASKEDLTDTRYRIGPGDVLSILVRKSPELSVDAVRVDQRGKIRIPMIEGDIQAACQTESDLADQIATMYLEYKKNPNVAVYVRDFQSRPVAVIGAVNAPAQFRLQRRVRLGELLAFASGPSQRAGRTISVLHSTETYGCRQKSPDAGEAVAADLISTYKLDDTLKGKEEANPFVSSGDIVSIAEADQVYVIGHVMSPQAISLRDKPITISRAIAMSGGPARDASTGKIRITREIGQGKQQIFVDLKAVLNQKAADIILAPNDIVEVPSSTGKAILMSLSGAIAPTLANVPVRMIP